MSHRSPWVENLTGNALYTCLKKDSIVYAIKLILSINHWKELTSYSIAGDRESMGWEIALLLGRARHSSVRPIQFALGKATNNTFEEIKCGHELAISWFGMAADVKLILFALHAKFALKTTRQKT